MSRSLVALFVAAIACGPRVGPPVGHVLLYFDTDAPVTDSSDPALFDTLSLEIIRPGESTPCKDCTHHFDLVDGSFKEKKVSIVVLPKPATPGYRVRARMFAASSTLDGLLPDVTPPWIVESVVALPPVGVEGEVECSVLLSTNAVGLPQGNLDAPSACALGHPQRSLVGSWPGGKRVPCANTEKNGAVCVPGGSYWMGNPRLRFQYGTLGDRADVRRLVTLSPFFLDSTEVTVSAYRSFASNAIPWAGGDGSAVFDYCTFTAKPGPHENWPVTCLTRAKARDYCNARGADLPTEAQFEYAASALRGALFVWGEDDHPSCEDAVLDRGGYRIPNGPCAPAVGLPTVDVVGSKVDPPRRDRLELDGGTIFDLVGNANEFVGDTFNRQDEPCWSAGGVYVDPLCATSGAQIPLRGGSSLEFAFAAAAAQRFPVAASAYSYGTGFRCASPDN